MRARLARRSRQVRDGGWSGQWPSRQRERREKVVGLERGGEGSRVRAGAGSESGLLWRALEGSRTDDLTSGQEGLKGFLGETTPVRMWSVR